MPDLLEAQTSPEPLGLSITPEHKALLERAAAALGQTVESFVLGHAISQAREVLKDVETLTLAGADRDRFLATLSALDQEPAEPLRRAAEAYQARVGRSS